MCHTKADSRKTQPASCSLLTLPFWPSLQKVLPGSMPDKTPNYKVSSVSLWAPNKTPATPVGKRLLEKLTASTMVKRPAELELEILNKDWIVDGRVVWATIAEEM